MRTQRNSRNIGTPQGAFLDDGIPNSPFKSSRSAAFTFAMIGVVLGGFFVIAGVVMAISNAAKTAPTQIVQPVKTSATAAVPNVAMAGGERRQFHISQAHAAQTHAPTKTKTVKKHAKAKSGSHAKSL